MGSVSSRRRARLRLRPAATLLRGRPLSGLPCPVESAAAKAIWLSASAMGGVWTHSSATNRRESRGQPKDRNSQGGPYAAGPDVRRSCLSAAAGGAVRKLDVAFLLVGPLRVAGARCHLWVYRAVHGRWPPSMRSGNSTVSTRPPLASVLRMRLIPRREGAIRCKASELQVRARPRVGWARPASGCFSHGHTPSRPAAIAQRTYEPACRRRETGVGAADNWLSRAPTFHGCSPRPDIPRQVQ